MPAGGDLRQYRGSRDWGSRGDAQRSMYDLCRDSAMTHDQARLHSEIGSARLAQEMGDGKGPAVAVRMGDQVEHEPTKRPRIPHLKTPWWGPFAGRLCQVRDDGTLEPVEG